MSRLFTAGDALPLYGRMSTLQAELAERDRGAHGEVRSLPRAAPAAAATPRGSCGHNACRMRVYTVSASLPHAP